MDFLRTIIGLRNKVPRKTNPAIELALDALEEHLGMNLKEPNVIGAFGDVVFEVSSMKVETMSDMRRQARGRYATHEIVGGKSVLEFLGTEPDEITFTMQLNADLGVDINEELGLLLELQRTGEPNYLIMGGKAHGVNQWCLTGLEMKTEYTDGDGRPLVMTVEVTLKESVL